MAYKEDHNIFVGSHLGTVKGLKVTVKDGVWGGVTKTIRTVGSISSPQGVTSMAWGDEEQKDVLVGFVDQTVKVYDTEYKSFVSSMQLNVGKGAICGISRFEEALVVGVESGHVKVVTHESEEKDILDVGGPLEKMKHSHFNKNIIAVGGKDKDLQLWDLEYKKCSFAAKNVRHDYLELQVPVWVSDMDFMSNSNKVALCSKYGHVRIYDPSTKQRRPVFNLEIPEQTLTACSASSSNSKIIVGSGTGHLFAVDIRGKGMIGHQYKGSVGGVKSVVCHPTEDLIISVGLDRYIKIHSLNSSKELYKEYLKTKLSCVLVREDFFYKHESKEVTSDSEIVEHNQEKNDEKSVKVTKEKRAYEKLFARMENIDNCPKKQKMKRKGI